MQEIFDLKMLDELANRSGLLLKLSSADRFKLYSTTLNYLLTYSLDTLDSKIVSEELSAQANFVPSDISMWPVDKNRKPLDLILEIKFNSMVERSLKLFLSSDIESFDPKERSWFYIWHPSDLENDRLIPLKDVERNGGDEIVLNATPFIDVGKFDEVLSLEDREATSIELFNEMKELFQRYNKTVLGAHWACSEYFQRARIARQKAAFYANGISFSAARQADPHFSHLLAESKNWFVLFNLRENSIESLSDDEILFCIKYDDFRSGEFYKGRPVIS